MGGSPKLLLPLGGATGKEMAGHLRRERLPARSVRLREATRVNVIITTAEGRQLRFNPAGPKLVAQEWRKILAETKRTLSQAKCLVLSGSLPRGVKAGAYAKLIRLARLAGVKTILDCDGAALAAAVAARPFLVKPNEHELGEWYGKPVSSRNQLLRAAQALSAKTGGWVLVSRGRHGGLLVNQKLKAVLSARPPNVRPVNTVGAGDAMTAAVALQVELGTEPDDWLRHGVAAGTAATQLQAGELPTHASINKIFGQVKVTGLAAR